MPRSQAFGDGRTGPHFHVPTPGRSPLNALSDKALTQQRLSLKGGHIEYSLAAHSSPPL
jgi:hypothetical protein